MKLFSAVNKKETINEFSNVNKKNTVGARHIMKIDVVFTQPKKHVFLLLLLLFQIFIRDKPTSGLETLVSVWALCSECKH